MYIDKNYLRVLKTRIAKIIVGPKVKRREKKFSFPSITLLSSKPNVTAPAYEEIK